MHFECLICTLSEHFSKIYHNCLGFCQKTNYFCYYWSYKHKSCKKVKKKIIFWPFLLSIRQPNGIHRLYPKVGFIRLTESNCEVGTFYGFFTECTRMSVCYFVFTDCIRSFGSKLTRNSWVRLKPLNIKKYKFNH